MDTGWFCSNFAYPLLPPKWWGARPPQIFFPRTATAEIREQFKSYAIASAKLNHSAFRLHTDKLDAAALCIVIVSVRQSVRLSVRLSNYYGDSYHNRSISSNDDQLMTGSGWCSIDKMVNGSGRVSVVYHFASSLGLFFITKGAVTPATTCPIGRAETVLALTCWMTTTLTGGRAPDWTPRDNCNESVTD